MLDLALKQQTVIHIQMAGAIKQTTEMFCQVQNGRAEGEEVEEDETLNILNRLWEVDGTLIDL